MVTQYSNVRPSVYWCLPSQLSSIMPLSLQIYPEELAAGRITPEHLRLAIRALYHDGILFLEHVYDTADVRGVELSPSENIASGKLFYLRQDWPARLYLSPLISQIASVFLGSEFHRLPRVPVKDQELSGMYRERSCEPDILSGSCASPPVSQVPIRALAVKILLAPLTLPVVAKVHGETQQNCKPLSRQEISAGGVIIWDMRRCEPNLFDGNLDHSKLENNPRVNTRALLPHEAGLEFVLGMRNYRCLQCGVFNLSVEGHIKNCPANRE
ncbi:hypothetical protein F5X99DRAFT_305345 [Biscogniauxia marginata]|nr:hypothetical protein F5X99DRAFT_305345 [Biscogniauxia marginata]